MDYKNINESELASIKHELALLDETLVTCILDCRKYQLQNNRLKIKIKTLENERHIYKLEMNRLRRKLTRIYEFVEEAWRDYPTIVALFRNR